MIIQHWNPIPFHDHLALDNSIRQTSRRIVLPWKPCGRGEIGRRIGLNRKDLSARRETGDAELLKVGEPFEMAIPSQARPEKAGKV
jgi:hypothetical protein